ncbi:MAG: hypothetical protein ACYTF3_02470 [Planctomycetota bacterium]
MCWQNCPAGYTDDGAFCRRDVVIINADNSNCPWYDVCGLTLAPGCSTCPAGYQNDGCTCRIDAHIFAKASYGRGVGQVPSRCPSGLELDGLLCYPPCNDGFYGVGPVCWFECTPDRPVDCGALCGTSGGACAEAIALQVLTPFEFVGNIVATVLTGGAAAAARTGGRLAATRLGTVAARAAAKELMKETLRNAAEEAGRTLTEQALDELAEGIIDASADGQFDWEALDPTGILAIIDAYDLPLCSVEPERRIVCVEAGCFWSDTGEPVESELGLNDDDCDSVVDDEDNCPLNENRDQSDRDGDGRGDVCDGCPDDGAKFEAGVCGCGTSDADSDGDTVPDCQETCDDDASKTEPGVCGCGVPDDDADLDGTPDCVDECRFDPDKTAPGDCGCGVADNRDFCTDPCLTAREEFDEDLQGWFEFSPEDDILMVLNDTEFTGGESGPNELCA